MSATDSTTNQETWEVHITVRGVDPDLMRAWCFEHDCHYSEIAGWDEVGEGHHQFATWHESTELGAVKLRLNSFIHDLEKRGVKVLRGKIECCIYEWRLAEVGLAPDGSLVLEPQ